MLDASIRKNVFRSMFRAESGRLNIRGNLGRLSVQEEMRVSAGTYVGPEHRLNLFSPIVQLSTLIPEHNTAPLRRAGFVQEGASSGTVPIRRPQVDVIPPRGASYGRPSVVYGRNGTVRRLRVRSPSDRGPETCGSFTPKFSNTPCRCPLPAAGRDPNAAPHGVGDHFQTCPAQSRPVARTFSPTVAPIGVSNVVHN